MLTSILLFVLGFVLLVKGADWLVEGGVSLARKFRISDFVIGLTIVSFGTSMPELIVNIMASFQSSSEIAIGNIIGSNIANILLILGISAVIFPLPIYRSVVVTEIPMSLAATFLVGFLANAALFSSKQELMLSRPDGVILLVFFFLFMTYIFYLAKEGKQSPDEDLPEQDQPVPKAVFLVLLGMFMLFGGGKMVVQAAVTVAQAMGLSETFIGLTVVAIGTSLPELVTSAMAALKKNTDIAVGNVIGSNIFNLLWILGLSSVIRPLDFAVVNNTDILMLILANGMLILALPTGKRGVIDRVNGTVFLLLYFGYMVFLIHRG